LDGNVPRATVPEVPSSTCIMVARESFSRWPAALEHMAGSVPSATRLIAVDGGSPPAIRRELGRLAPRHDVLLLETDEVLGPHTARAAAVPHVTTEFTVFIDNDAFGDEKWLETLQDAAEQTGAWAVGPIYSIGHPDEGRVHMAGGRNQLVDRDGTLDLVERHLFSEAELVATLGRVTRGPTELIEFHCVLVRTCVLETVPLDPAYRSLLEHNAFCLRVREAGGEVWLEPASRVTYCPVMEPTSEDLRYFRRRWSRSWNSASARHFAGEFGIAERRVLQLDTFRFASEYRLHGSRTERLLALTPNWVRRRAVAGLVGLERRLAVAMPAVDPEPLPELRVVHRPSWHEVVPSR